MNCFTGNLEEIYKAESTFSNAFAEQCGAVRLTRGSAPCVRGPQIGGKNLKTRRSSTQGMGWQQQLESTFDLPRT